MSSTGTTGSTGDDLVETDAAAAMLGVSEWTVTRWCRRGRLRTRRPGYAWQVYRDSIEALLAPPIEQEATR
jgi:excisionase family DNA binding protein